MKIIYLLKLTHQSNQNNEIIFKTIILNKKLILINRNLFCHWDVVS